MLGILRLLGVGRRLGDDGQVEVEAVSLDCKLYV